MDNIVNKLIVISLILLSAMLGSILTHSQKAKDFYQEGQTLVKACEKELPRNQTCEAIITVRIKK